MSAYGVISAPRQSSIPLSPTIWAVEAKDSVMAEYLTIHHLNLSLAQTLDGLLDYLYHIFAEEIDAGLTYPQEVLTGEVYTREAFDAYFFAGDVFVAISGAESGSQSDGSEILHRIDEARRGREWRNCIAGYYYVKPNYPGRSSHICNGGFVIPPAQRGKRYGTVLGKSYVHYAPKLGYQASVFNLVYVNNIASVRIWEALGFEKAGRIPCAGRLKRKDGKGEEYVDAWVFYKSFLQ
ncbi:hypothetical protein NEOLEDRAFT_1069368 [Neolentinus lepideus HHB14362 ss-1]|uniref:N-acetyltransferase domain-containing protein n=1 Tax=Neolentinus lepideus HHB14362 ss-1 TaxID=1314782 RepID=A0A165R9M7_9AGAM|nr:hypothetical protein NEOLEDRAFT_1069368 [Neolentinus lepideus HHB14362 ss-1]